MNQTSESERSPDILALLDDARRRTWELLATVPTEDLYRQHSPLMSPIAWDLGHIGNFEELWGIRALPGAGEVHPELDEIYDATKNPRSTRASLPLPDLDEFRRTLDTIRASLKSERARLAGSDHPLVKDDFVYRMLLQHEYQHNETILQTLQLKLGQPYRPGIDRREMPTGNPELVGSFARLPGGVIPIGTDILSGVYDNERPRHTRTIAPFDLGVVPVTNGEFRRFVDDGGYRDRSLWSQEGWSFIIDHDVSSPMYWEQEGSDWFERTMNRRARLDPLCPVIHVCFHEAEAYCRWAGVRLPTEFEWEYAASFDPENSEEPLGYPWGASPWNPSLANLDVAGWGTTQVGAYPEGASRLGIHQLLGDIWEWTSSPFSGYPGFQAFPYEEYSKIFFGDEYRVLRGGSWATRPGAVRTTFRNWDYPIRRQIFAGFRVAREA